MLAAKLAVTISALKEAGVGLGLGVGDPAGEAEPVGFGDAVIWPGPQAASASRTSPAITRSGRFNAPQLSSMPLRQHPLPPTFQKTR